MEETEAIVLKSLDYKDHERILTLFSKSEGLVSLIVKGVTPTNFQKLTLTTPFVQAQFFFVRGKSELLRYRDSTLLDEHAELRSSLAHLQAAGAMAKALLKTQLPGKPSSALYALFSSYLKQLSKVDPHTIATSFLLKMLQHEGLFHLADFQEKALVQELTNCRSFKKLEELKATEPFMRKVEEHFYMTLGR